MKTLLALIFLLAFSLPVKAMDISIEFTFQGYLCDAGVGGCLGGTAGYLLDLSGGRLVSR